MEPSSFDYQKILYGECGAFHNAVISENGRVFTWGRGDAGQLGLLESELEHDKAGRVLRSPKRVSAFNNTAVLHVSLGDAHTIVLDKEGQVYTFGYSEYGQLGVKVAFG